MKAAYLTGIERMEVREAPEPQILQGDEVKLRVEAVGVCGSDMHYYRTGRIGDQVVKFPFAVGHEFAGEVVELGPEVTGLKLGQRVAVDPLVACGKCDQCIGGREHTCRSQTFLGVPGQADGALMEYIVMPARCCFVVPELMSAEQAVMIEPFSIGLYAQRLAGEVASKTFAILGSGPIGLSVLEALKAAGAERVYMTDIREYRCEFAHKAGADWVGNPQTRDVAGEIRSAEPLGVDVAFECAGEQETVDQAVRLVKPGGSIILVGIPEVDRISFEMNAMRRSEIHIRNVRRQNGCVQPAIDLVASGQVDVASMVTHRFSLDQVQEAFDAVSNYRDGVVKAIINLA